jgi:DNA-binding transcriptional LysR family regulator
MLDVRRLRVLREVARHGSLSAAASALGYTQPAVSRQIAVLESEVGITLLRRLPQGVVLTDAGRLLVDRAEEVFASLARTEEELRAHAQLGGGTLRMAVFASAAASVAPIAMTRFRERHPAVELIVTVADLADSLPQLRAGEVDLALCDVMELPLRQRRGRADPAGPRLELVPLFDDPFYVALPRSHPLAEARTLPLRQLAHETWLLAADDCPDAERFYALCAAEGVEPHIAFHYDDYGALLGFVAAGMAIAVIPDMVARFTRDDVVLRTPAPPMTPRTISAAVPVGYRPAAVSAMLEILLAVAPEWVAGQLQPVAAPAAVTSGA